MGGITVKLAETVRPSSMTGSVNALTAAPIDRDPGNGTIMTVEVVGDVDTAATVTLRRVLLDVIMRRRPVEFVLDLYSVTDLDPAAVGALQAARALADDMNVRMTLRTSRWNSWAELDGVA